MKAKREIKMKKSRKFRLESYAVECPYCKGFIECFGERGEEKNLVCVFCGEEFLALESEN